MSGLENETFLANDVATRDFGSDLAEHLESGTVICLSGDLGAGKTTMVQGMVRGLECPVPASSPTFALVQEYLGGRMPIHHFDFYRIESAAELIDLGWDDYLDRDGLVIVEWPELHPELIPDDARWFQLEHVGSGGRLVKKGKNPSTDRGL